VTPGGRADRPGLAISYALGSSLVISTLDACVKLLARDYPILTIAWARSGIMAVLFALFSYRSFGWRMFRPQSMRAQCVRAAAAVVATLAFYEGLSHLPLAECIAIVFISPILTTLIAGRYLTERATVSTWITLAGSFFGVLMIVRPGGGLFDWTALFPLIAAVGLALYQVATRVVAEVDDARVSMFFSSIAAFAAFSLLLPFGFAAPRSGADAGLLLLTSVLAAAGQLMLTVAFRHAPAPLVASVGYSGIVVGLLLGWLIFGHVPDVWALSGMAVITAFGIMTVVRH